MVLHGRLCGRVGQRRVNSSKPALVRQSGFFRAYYFMCCHSGSVKANAHPAPPFFINPEIHFFLLPLNFSYTRTESCNKVRHTDIKTSELLLFRGGRTMDEDIKGKWLGLVNSPGDLRTFGDGQGVYGVHAALLNSGRVILWSGRVEGSGYLYRSWTWDPGTFNEGDTVLTGVQGRWFLSDFDIGGPNESPPGPAPTWADDETIDLFCAHQVVLEDGRLLVVGGAGGSVEGDARGNRAVYTYSPDREQWTKESNLLIKGRWYPTAVTLPDGRVAVFSGRPESGSGQEEVAEILGAPNFQPSVISGADKDLYIYPGLILVPGGKIFYIPTNWMIEDGTTTAEGKINPTVALNLTGSSSGNWETFEDPASPGTDIKPINPWREEGTFVLLPPAQAGRIMAIGGGFAEDALGNSDQRAVARIDHCEILETQGGTPRWTEAGQLRFGRVNVHAVLLPDGKVLILGGHSSVKRNPTHQDRLIAEIYDPTVSYDPANPSAAFTEAAVMGTSRNYHATALLIPDGRVLVAGGEDNPHFGGNQTSVELYEPPYFFKGTRPTLASVGDTGGPSKEVAFGESFIVTAGTSDEAASIEEVVLIRPGAATHHTDTEQRHIPLNFSYSGGNTLQVTAPIDPTVALPGYYMLWIIDTEKRPCKNATFIRLSHRRCRLITDRSTFSIDEIESLPSRTVEDVFYVHMDGFLPDELGITTPTPTPATIEAWAPNITFRDSTGILSGISARATGLLLEQPSLPADIRQRFTFRYSIRIDNLSLFPPVGGADRVILQMEADKLGWTCIGRIDLTRQPNPYMLDGPTHWLSTDVRVFKVRAGESRFGITLNSGDPLGFLQQVLNQFDANPSLAGHPFAGLPEEQANSRLQLAETEGGTPVYNFAVCRVRYRAQTVAAQNLRVHFRMFTTAATNLSYQPSSTYRIQPGAGTNIALPGVVGNEVVTIPFFASTRIDLSSVGFSSQEDPTNQKTIPAQPSGAESRRYFGALLDINLPNSQLPQNLAVTDTGPFPSSDLEPITNLIRGRHQCLVAEVDFPADPISPGDNPANSDNLSQRNLAIEESDNPGGPDSHTVAMTFDIEPTWGLKWAQKWARLPEQNLTRAPGKKTHHAATHIPPRLDPLLTDQPHMHFNPQVIKNYRTLGEMANRPTGLLNFDPVGVRFEPVAHEHRPAPNFTWFQPDEILIEWGELPDGTTATLFLPDLEAEHILTTAKLRGVLPKFSIIDSHTLSLEVKGTTFLQLPTAQKQRQAGLLTITLPESVRVGQLYRVVVRQISHVARRVVGSFQLNIPVSLGSEIAIEESRWFAVLQHIASSLKESDRWYPVMLRYLDALRKRLKGFGVNPADIRPTLNPKDICDPAPKECIEDKPTPHKPKDCPEEEEKPCKQELPEKDECDLTKDEEELLCQLLLRKYWKNKK